MSPDSAPDSLLVYGILRAAAADEIDADSVAGPGVQNRPVSIVERGGLAAITSASPSSAVLTGADTDDVLAHKGVVDRVFARTTVIPVRFGTTIADADALRRHLEAEASSYRSSLDRLDGQSEMGIRVSLRQEGIPESSGPASAYRSDRPGTAYLLARHRKRDGRRRQVVRTYRTGLEGRFESMTTSAARSQQTVSMAFLVARSQTRAFREAAEGIRASRVQSVDVVGPWAPYSFV